MSEETTPIEELIETELRHTYDDKKRNDYMIKFINELLKAYRDKYKHPREDVEKAFRDGIYQEAIGRNSEGNEARTFAREYYNETHNKQT